MDSLVEEELMEDDEGSIELELLGIMAMISELGLVVAS